MITNRVIQAFYNKANAADGDVMRWSDFLDCMQELRNPDTTDLTPQDIRFGGLPVYDDDAAAATGGLTGGELYVTSTGEARIKLPES